MREYATPWHADRPGPGNLTDDLVARVAATPDAVAYARRDVDRPGSDWAEVTWTAFHDQVRAVAKGLVAAGIEPGERVALMSRTRYEWTLLDYAIWYAGAVTVPVYETSAAPQVQWILSDSGARAAIVETAAHQARVDRSALSELHHLWTIESGAVDVLTRLGGDVEDDALEARRSAAGAESPATIIYTSGTTGRPKGCVLTHGNFRSELTAATTDLHELFDGEDACTLLFLPLAHVFARIIQIGCVQAGVRLAHTADISHLLPDLAEVRPTFLLGVPRVFEKVFNNASQRAVADGRGRIFDRAAETAMAWSRAQEERRVPVRVRAQHAVFDRLVYAKLRAALGGRCRYAISGGAPLGERLGHFFRGIGVTVLEGYGMTETTAAVTVNLPEATKVGSVGRPLQGTAVRVAEDGELLFRGDQVFGGYHGDPAATAATLDSDGWVHTGDLGEIDDEGFVRITGRKKEILVTAGGKNVAPAVLEDRVRAHPLVDQCLVVGDGRPFIGALVTLDPEGLAPWAERHGKSSDVRRLVDDADLQAEIQKAVDEANKSVSQAESIRKFAVLPVVWTEETGELTPSLKLRRSVVMRQVREDVDALYVR